MAKYKIQEELTRLTIRTEFKKDSSTAEYMESNSTLASTVSYLNANVCFEYKCHQYSEAVRIAEIMEVDNPGNGDTNDVHIKNLNLSKEDIDDKIATAIEKRVKEIDKEDLQRLTLSKISSKDFGYPMDV